MLIVSYSGTALIRCMWFDIILSLIYQARSHTKEVSQNNGCLTVNRYFAYVTIRQNTEPLYLKYTGEVNLIYLCYSVEHSRNLQDQLMHSLK